MVEIATRSGAGSRQTHHINRKPASHLHHAVRFATFIGLPLSCLVTINFDHTVGAPETVSRQFERLRKIYFGPWLRRPGKKTAPITCPPTYVWVIENGGGQPGVHWLVHIPPTRLADFSDRLREWVAIVAGEITSEAAIRIEDAYNPHSFSHYMLKGMDPQFAALYGVRSVPQGVVYGKRSGFSRNLGPAARTLTSYRPRKDFHIWHRSNGVSNSMVGRS